MASAQRPPRAQPARDDRVQVGRIVRPHGVRGEVAVESWSDYEHRFERGAELWIGGSRAPMRIVGSRRHRGGWLLTLEGVNDRDGAETLRGAVLEVGVEQLPTPPEGSYYLFDLIGCRFEDVELGELGEVGDVIEDGGGLLLQIEGDERQLLVPFVRDYLETVDLTERRIVARLPPGLVETCASTS